MGSHAKRPYSTYKELFDRLVSTGISIVLFLDKRSDWTFPANVWVERVSLEDTWVGKNVLDNAMLPSCRDSCDTLEYMKIINSKSEWIYRASQKNPWKTDWFAWIDFGIFHVISQKETIEHISSLKPPTQPCLKTAGIWNKGSYDAFERVCWRFAGGFLMIHTSKAKEFHEQVCRKIQDIHPRFAWEVNLWYLLEKDGMDMGWYSSDHNDRIIPTM